MPLIIYLAIINALSFLFMRSDKRKAVKKRRRIPERVLLTLCALGGSLGGYTAMRLYRHKTRRPTFSIGIPILLAVHILLLIIVYIACM